MKSGFSKTAIAVACATLFAPSLATSAIVYDYFYGNGSVVELDVSTADCNKKVIAGQSAIGTGEGKYNWNNDTALPGVQDASGLLQDLETSLVVKGSGWVNEEVVAGSYIHPNDNKANKALAVHLNSTSVVIDGAKIKKGVVGGSKTNNWSTETVNYTTDSTSVHIKNGALVQKFVLGGDMLKFAGNGNDDYQPLTSGIVKQAQIVVEGGSTVGGIVAGAFVQHNNNAGNKAKIVGEVKSTSVVVDGSTVKPIGYLSDKPYDFDAPFAVVAGGFVQASEAYDMTSIVGESRVDIRNKSQVDGDVLLGGLLLVDEKPSDVPNVDAKLELNKVTLNVVDSTVNGSIVTGNQCHYDVQDVPANSAAPEGLLGSTKAVEVALHNAIVRDAVKGLGSDKSTLTLSGTNKVGTLEDFPSVNLMATAANNLDANGKPILTLTGSSIDFSGVTFNLFGELEAGTNVALFKVEDVNALVGKGETKIVGHGTFVDQTWKGTATELKAELEAGQLNTGSVSFEAKANDNTKTLSEVRLGSIAMINQGAEFIADEGLAAIQSVATNEGLATFGAMLAGTSEYETGSSVDLDSWNMVVGVASKVSDVTLAGFAEYGTGSSDAKVAQAKADGDHSYYGVGVAARWGEAQGLFVDSAIRLGMSNTEFSGVYASNGSTAKYDSDAFYSTFHVGTGYTFPMAKAVDMTVYGRYVLTYLDGDNLNLEGTANKYDADSVTTHALRVGMRATGDMLTNAKWRLGLAYEHTFDGDADATVSGIALDAPSLAGNTGILEAGLTMKPSATLPWTVDFGLKGYVGDRQGVTGSAMAVYKF